MTWRRLILAIGFARVIAGEASTCNDPAVFVALAHVNANRLQAGISGGWYGDADPSAAHVWAALFYDQFPDSTQGALFAMGTNDHPAFLSGQVPVLVYHCDEGQSVRFFK